ncbi:hypothetical protein GMORB2_1535 [Geosmithia morbida]|uniref:Uncharacterized protein n=1 Tax=Geosmithia morbida TaxID=1094350 RepID=A0A9P5D2P9_9HYPO|nr:uncharacterized protein GMORB2_1535 [Geosmithia morbida]KAF4121696.1 hypothetical protein GMORB2_1535 [Geosmithia morbida]
MTLGGSCDAAAPNPSSAARLPFPIFSSISQHVLISPFPSSIWLIHGGDHWVPPLSPTSGPPSTAFEPSINTGQICDPRTMKHSYIMGRSYEATAKWDMGPIATSLGIFP